jgi:putative ABC transport system substrate-binding protein
VLRDTEASAIGQFAAIQTLAPIDLKLSTINLGDARQIERAIAAFARDPNGGLIVTASGFAVTHREMIATLAAQHNLPAVYPFPLFRRGWRPDFLRARRNRPLPARGGLR